jgi:hypothetical protein
MWVFWKGRDGGLESVTGRVAGSGITWPNRPATVPRTGRLGSQPAVGSDAAGSIFVYWRDGRSGNIFEVQRNATRWSGAAVDLRFIGRTGSPPSVAVSGSGQQYVFWEGLNLQLWYAESTGTTWLDDAASSPGDGPLGSQPAAMVSTEGGDAEKVYVYWKGEDLNVWTTSSPTSTGDWALPSSVENGPFPDG